MHILMIDDCKEDIYMLQEAYRQIGSTHTLEGETNGETALERIVSKDDLLCPDMILLDINMPLIDGFEVLDRIKATKQIKHIPVIMYTTSTAKTDVLTSYQKYSNSYVVKPAFFDDYKILINQIEQFWINTAKIPDCLT